MTISDPWLDRRAVTALLAELGIPCASATLATKACRGGGPPFQKFGPRVLYRKSDVLRWAESKLSPPRRSTSEADRAEIDAVPPLHAA